MTASADCSYRRGMRAAASKDCARALSWQSQRETRRSLDPALTGTGFHPVPSQSGQTSAGTLITHHARFARGTDECVRPDTIFIPIRLCNGTGVLRKAESLTICVHPVQEWRLLWRTLENQSASSAKPPRKPKVGRRSCETGFRRGFSQLTFARMRGQYSAVRFPNPVITQVQSRFRLGTNETCEEKL